MITSNNLPRKAGFTTKAVQNSSAECLKFDARPDTPDQVGKYRKSFYKEPGQRVTHHGKVDDLANVDYFKKFGGSTDKGEQVADVIPQKVPTDHDLISLAKEEALYASRQREPLGKSYQRGHKLPDRCSEADFQFGYIPKNADGHDASKKAIYPYNTDDDTRYEEQYRKSHGRSKPGEQLNRMYDWEKAKINPVEHKFGIQAKSAIKNGVGMVLNPDLNPTLKKATVTSKQVEDMRSTFDQLGRVKNTGNSQRSLPENHVFGVGGSMDEWGAQKIIQGEYALEDQQPDFDLGKSTTPGWRNTTLEERPYGVPTIRADIPKPHRRSVADHQNYGDDVDAHYLLYPDQFASKGINDEEFSIPRTRREIQTVFTKIGHDLDYDVFDLIWKIAAQSQIHTRVGQVSIQEFQNVLNDYLDAKDDGSVAVERWIQRMQPKAEQSSNA